MTLLFLVLAATLEVAGDYVIRKGLAPLSVLTMLAGGALLALYGVAVNVHWRGEFGKLLGLYVVVFFLASQAWGVAIDGERIDAARAVGGTLIVAGGVVIQFWR
jgi:drug/metabolite transporter superfamily protein YnfA